MPKVPPVEAANLRIDMYGSPGPNEFSRFSNLPTEVGGKRGHVVVASLEEVMGTAVATRNDGTDALAIFGLHGGNIGNFEAVKQQLTVLLENGRRFVLLVEYEMDARLGPVLFQLPQMNPRVDVATWLDGVSIALSSPTGKFQRWMAQRPQA